MKTLKRLVVVFAAAVAAVAMLSFDDVPQLNAILQKLATYNAKYPEEKTYIHLDKPFYKPGETIWFSFYSLNGVTHLPSSISSAAYVQLIDPKGNVIAQPEMYVRDGVSYGDFKLDDKAPGGIYKLKAYTQWNLNFKNQKQFEKEIQVQNIITPRLLLKLDWEKEAYGPGDSAVAIITARDLKDELLNRAEITYKVFIGGREAYIEKVYTSGGKARAKFLVPPSTLSPDGLLQAVVSSDGVQESISRSIPIVLNKINLQFFPEGGDLVASQQTQVAFKALNEFGKAVDIEGEILADNEIVARFESYHMGMGAFQFNPGEKKYTARITKPAGIKEMYLMPVVNRTGYTLTLQEQSNGVLKFNIHSTSPGRIYLVCTIHGQAVWQKAVDAIAGTNSVEVDSGDGKFVQGIGVFTLFDGGGIPKCERLVYVNKGRQLNVSLETDKKTYKPGEKVDVDIKTTDANGAPIPARLSLAVVDDQLLTFADDKQDNILSWFLLSSEVKGEIQEPSFYFDETEEKATRAMDYLLMTQGWRRFDWRTITSDIPIAYMPDKEGNISGYTLRQNVTSKEKAEITMIEMGNRRRAKKIMTRDDGSFDFVNVDPTVPTLLLARRNYSIFLTGQEDIKINGFVTPPQKPKASERTEEFKTSAVIDPAPLNEPASAVTTNLSMSYDVASLSEVVVTGYGMESRRDLTGSVTSVRTVDLPTILLNGVESALQGRVAGVTVIGPSGSPATSSNILIRGAASPSPGNYEPLYVIDGVPLSASVNPNFSPFNIVSPDNIEYIQVSNTPEMPTMYGSRAANGVIVVGTKSGSNETSRYAFERKKRRYNYIIVPQRAFTPGREFYVPPVVRAKDDDQRRDFRTTVFWKQHIVTDKNGKASISFTNNDNTSVFRITAEGITANGLIGRQESTYSTQMPFSVDVKLPEFIGFEDTVKLAVRLNNATQKSITATLAINAPKELIILPSNTIEVQVVPSTTTTAYITVLSRSVPGTYPIIITTRSKEFSDEIKHQIIVHPVGFPVRQLWSSSEAEKTIDFNIGHAEKGSLTGKFEGYPDLLGSLFSDAEAMIREPHGCFEQVSSSTFPNIMALQYMRKFNKMNKAIEDRALAYIRSGYNQLMAYEIRRGGFEWFGDPPAHEALSAFGMIEFFEMQKVYPGVDRDVVSRTAAWLLERRNGHGGFNQNHGKYGFSAAPTSVNNAYIVYALAATGHTGFEAEYNQVVREAVASKDLYRMALAAIASYHLRKPEQYQSLISHFKQQVEKSGLDAISAQSSIVRSYGENLRLETIGFWVIAMAKDPGGHFAEITQCVKYLLANKKNYGYGSTQTTTVCLQALCVFHDVINGKPSDGVVTLVVNNADAGAATYKANDAKVISMEDFVNKLSLDGKQTVRVKFAGESPMPWQLQLEWYSKLPSACESCNLGIKTTMGGTVKLNETIRLTMDLINKSDTGLPMSMAVIGIPAGLSVQPWQLKELQEKGAFDYYEILGDRLALYYRELAPSATTTINLDLKAEIAGSYRGAATTAYLYYNSECKQWAEGVPVTIEP